jgi:hypothetical protein
MGARMSKRAKGAGPDRGARDIRTLEMMLDYAIIEGAELRLPLFVLLLRSARLELMTGIEALGGLCDRRVATKVKDCFERDGAKLCAAPGAAPRDSADVIEDR